MPEQVPSAEQVKTRHETSETDCKPKLNRLKKINAFSSDVLKIVYFLRAYRDWKGQVSLA